MSISKVIFLAGAPKADTLDWNEERLLHSFESPLKRFLGQQQLDDDIVPSDTQASPSLPTAKWRKVLMNDDERFGYASTQHGEPQSLLRPEVKPQTEDLAFEEHSFAHLDGLSSSQIAPGTMLQEEEGDSTFISLASLTSSGSNSDFDTSFNTTNMMETSLIAPSTPTTIQIPASIAITDLKSLPTAQTLLNLHPQTPTVNLLVAIISVSPIRTVQLRRPVVTKAFSGHPPKPQTMDLLEVIVGDDTRAGFKITFWLASEQQWKNTTNLRPHQVPIPGDDLRSILSARRSGEVVLVRNAALAAFRGVVFGQSLNRNFAKNSTEVTVLGEDRDPPFAGPVASKWQRVRNWRDDFVGKPVVQRKESLVARTGKRKRRSNERLGERDLLPPDTQD